MEKQSQEKQAHKLYDKERNPIKDRPWIFRTYGGHTNAKETNLLFKKNLQKGQTGLSIAFDLPTQCGYDSDSPIARPEVGKVGVPINSLEDFRILFDGIPIEQMNTSMTINGTAMWLLSLYIALAEERGIPIQELRGTTQNDIIKEYLARGTYIFPPEASMKLIVDMYEYCVPNVPKWNPSNICSYHLQEAGATPTQEVAFAVSTAIAVLDAIQKRNCFTAEQFEMAVGRISFFVNSGIRFVEEMCKMRVFAEKWNSLAKDYYKVKNPKYSRFRYGVQVNSLCLTEEQPENNAWRILIETLGVVLSRKARCRALQLPTWNEALSLPRPWDQQWSLRLQQILAYETDILEYPDLFDGSHVVESKVREMKEQVNQEIEKILEMGGALEAIISGYMKSELVKSQSIRVSNIMNGDTVVIGRNQFLETVESPLTTGDNMGIFQINKEDAKEAIHGLESLRQKRDKALVKESLEQLQKDAQNNKNLMEASIKCAKALVTTGEWAHALRNIYGDYRPITGIEGQSVKIPKNSLQSIQKEMDNFEK